MRSFVPTRSRVSIFVVTCHASATGRGTRLHYRLHRRKKSTHALEKMARDRFRAMSSAPSQKCPRNVVEMK